MFEEDWFNFIHFRLLLAGDLKLSVAVSTSLQVSEVSCWLLHITHCNCLRRTKPWGYFEIHEVDPHFYSDDGTLSPDSSVVQWSNLIYEASAKNCRPISISINTGCGLRKPVS